MTVENPHTEADEEDLPPGEAAEAALDPAPEEADPGSVDAEPSFDVTSGEDLVDRLPADDEIPDDVKRSFWTTVILLKVALLSLTLAVLLAVFRSQFLIAGGLAAVGLFASGRMVREIREFYRD